MREVRMTFGEHLEELRKRVLISLIYVFIGIIISFFYGNELLQLALQPHEKAFEGAQRNRLIARMEKVMEGLGPLMTSEPYEATAASGKKLVEGDIRWEELFIGDVLRQRLEEAVSEPFSAPLTETIDALGSIAAEDRERLKSAFRELGTHLGIALVREIATTVDFEGAASIPRRFESYRERLERLRQSETGSTLKRSIGWGRDLAPLIEKVEEFCSFLQWQKKQALRGAATFDDLKASAKSSALAHGLDESLNVLEKASQVLEQPESRRIMVIDYTEHFMAYLKVAMIFGLFFSVPFVLYEMWKFVGAGLHLHEQRYVVTFMPFSLALFAAGAIFGYKIMIPVGLEFLASWGDTDVELNFVLGNYVGLFLTLTLVLGLIFQTPLLMVFLNKVGIVDVAFYRRTRRIAVFLGVCLAVILTPPDPVSWSLMAAPMIILYEIGIIVCRILSRSKKEIQS
ncbi:MAG: twin-arginine translocase subunit TatC [Planctomycetes bacterium]|nr:twin-arginine translocase subunit TatC [Planctomycetota bacterium]